MAVIPITKVFCDTLKRIDGRQDHLKQKLMKIVRQAISHEEAVVSMKILLSADWRRDELHYYGYGYDIRSLDYDLIVSTFWRLWRRKASDYDYTYVKYHYKMLPNLGRGITDDSWTYMCIFVGDSREKLSRWYFTPRFPYITSELWCFAADRQVVSDWIRRWQNFGSDDARITVNVYGDYGNKYRNTSRQFFDYEFAMQ